MKFERAIAFGCELIRIPSLSGEEGAVESGSVNGGCAGGNERH
jgi:hypothetical protein